MTSGIPNIKKCLFKNYLNLSKNNGGNLNMVLFPSFPWLGGRQPPGWEKIITNCVSDKGLRANIYKELTELHNNKNNNTKQDS